MFFGSYARLLDPNKLSKWLHKDLFLGNSLFVLCYLYPWGTCCLQHIFFKKRPNLRLTTLAFFVVKHFFSFVYLGSYLILKCSSSFISTFRLDPPRLRNYTAQIDLLVRVLLTQPSIKEQKGQKAYKDRAYAEIFLENYDIS